jgi:hypothetical protein
MARQEPYTLFNPYLKDSEESGQTRGLICDLKGSRGSDSQITLQTVYSK